MPEKILGLDIGTSSVKAVLLSRGFRGGYRLLGFRLIGVAAPEALPQALEQLFADPSYHGSHCVTALPAGMLSFRNLRLPFRDDRKIRQTLAFALEPLIQPPLDEVFIDYTVTGRTDQTDIFAAIAARSLVGERTAMLAPYVREVPVIDIDAVPLASRLMEKPDFPETALVLDVGARDATAIFTGKRRILQIRHFPYGGETMTRAVAEALKIDTPRAEEIKRSDEIPPEAQQALREACCRFCLDLKNTQASLLWQGVIPQVPAAIFLTGGGARTPGLMACVTEFLAAPCERTDLGAAEKIEIPREVREEWDPALLDQALALAARPMAKGSGFNFRQRAFEARAGYGQLRERLKTGVVVASVIAILAGLEIGLDDYASRVRLTALKKEIIGEFKKSDPTVTRIVDPVVQLKGKIGEARKLSAGMGDAATAPTVLDLLKEISGLAPADIIITSFNLDGDAIALKGEAKNFDAVDALKKAFANSKYFKTVTIGQTSMLKQEGAVEFDLKITLKR